MLRLLPRFKQSAGFLSSLHLIGDTAAGASRRKRVSLRMFVVRSNHQLYTTCSSNNTDWVIALFFAFSSNCSCNFCFALKQIFSLFSSIDFDATCCTLLGRIFFSDDDDDGYRWYNTSINSQGDSTSLSAYKRHRGHETGVEFVNYSEYGSIQCARAKRMLNQLSEQPGSTE